MFNVGPTELMVILVLALIVFGPKKLPEMGKSIGKGLREFRKAQMDIRKEISEGLRDTPSSEAGSASTGAAGTGTPASDGRGASVGDGQGTSESSSA
ncbi:MAG TPA: twin-arginine translocase TatA/TatE family subunit [Actinomycetota bacterium]